MTTAPNSAYQPPHTYGPQDRRDDTLGVGECLDVREAQDADAERVEVRRAHGVVGEAVARVVLAAISLDGEVRFGAVEVEDVRSRAVLPPELVALEGAGAQESP